jgi:uncharacterized protein YbjT (DUF2867 family)
MKYVITGSIGNISKPVVEQLASAGHDVTVITRDESKTKEIESLNAKSAVGSVDDVQFLTTVFARADAVYLMIPPNFAAADHLAFQKSVADNYIQALGGSSVKYIVVLSSIGAHLRKGAGPIDGVGYLEERLMQAFPDTAIKILRPSYFYHNLFSLIGLIRNAGIMGGNINDGSEKMVLVHPLDIASRVAHHLLNPDFDGYSIEYISSDERSTEEIASVIGGAINKPDLKWVPFTDEQTLQGMMQAGLPAELAKQYTQMGKALRAGLVQEDYWKNRQAVSGKYKLEDFAAEFAHAYHA